MGVAGIVLGGVLDKELRDFEAIQRRRREVGGLTGSFGVLLVEGFGKVGIDPQRFAWFRAHAGRMASLFGADGLLYVYDAQLAPGRRSLPRVGERVIAHRRPFQGRPACSSPSSRTCTRRHRASRRGWGWSASRTAGWRQSRWPTWRPPCRCRPLRLRILAVVPTHPGGVITSRSAAETRAVGRSLGRAATPGTLLALTGPLGAGKTQLAKGVAEGWGRVGGEQPHLHPHERA